MKIKGENILEVWDFRLSKGSPVLYANGETWRVKIFANNPGEEKKVLLDEHDTGISTDGGSDDKAAIIKCYEWLLSVRDEYERDHIEDRKPITKMINAANTEASRINTEADKALAEGDADLANQLKGGLSTYVNKANAAIKKATSAFHAKVNAGGAS